VSRRGSRFVAPLVLAAFFTSPLVLADVTKDQCVDANGKGQELRREGKLTAAREQLRLCSHPACPAMVRDDCTKRLDDLERAQPTIAFEVKDASGADVSAVQVTMDGKPLAERLDGTALPVDIGEHVFTFEVAGQPPVTRTLVLTEGAKGRRERIALGKATPSTTPPVPPAPSPAPVPEANAPAGAAPGSTVIEPAPTAGGMGTQKILGLVAGGVGVAGIAVGSIFGLMTSSEINQQKTDCASPTSCPNRARATSDHSAGSSDGAISTVAFIAGGALLAAGGILFFMGGQAPESTATTGLVITPGVGPGGGGMSIRGKF
jgi:hypothetical protein